MRQPVKKQTAYELPNHQGFVAAIPQRASRVNGSTYQQKRSVPPQMEEDFSEDDEDYGDELPASRTAWRGTSARNLQKSPYTYAYPSEQIQEGSDTGKGVRRKTHRLLYLSLFVLVILVCWIGLNALSSFAQQRMNDFIYGFPRVYQTDENVGHFNSVSHFFAINLKGQIEVIEVQPGNEKATHIYPITQLSDDELPVTLRFQDLNGDGKIDILVIVGSFEIPMYNNGTSFQPQPPVPGH